MPTFFQFSEKWKIHSHHQLQKILSFHFIICIFLFAEILVPLIIPSPFLLNLWEKFLSNDSFIKLISCQGKHYSKFICLNQFIPNAPFLYPLKTSENLTVFCFTGQRKGALETKGLICAPGWLAEAYLGSCQMPVMKCFSCENSKLLFPAIRLASSLRHTNHIAG